MAILSKSSFTEVNRNKHTASQEILAGGWNAFSALSPTLWNILPQEVASAPSLLASKKFLKTGYVAWHGFLKEKLAAGGEPHLFPPNPYFFSLF